MKYRKDFVTNSSSSSFVCDVCGHTESGWDMCLSETEMFECENGHTICRDEAMNKTLEELTSILVDEYKLEMPEENTQEELVDYILDYDAYSVTEKLCPICNFKEYTEQDMLRYIGKKYNLDFNNILQEWKEKFKNYKELEKYLWGK